MSDGKKKKGYQSSADRVRTKKTTFPPDRWDPQEVSKTRPPTGKVHLDADIRAVQGRAATARPVPPSEATARDAINDRFIDAGYTLLPDYNLTLPTLLVRLDAYDPDRKVGFVYLSHSDTDVVSDFGQDEERQLDQLDQAGKIHVLVIHDTDIPSEAQLKSRVDAFLARLRERYS